jgi:hypothetical protein
MKINSLQHCAKPTRISRFFAGQSRLPAAVMAPAALWPTITAGLVFSPMRSTQVSASRLFSGGIAPQIDPHVTIKIGLQLKVRWMIFWQVDHSATIHPNMAVKMR